MEGRNDAATGGLRRELGLRDAVLLGLGSILGTGVFVTLAAATQLAGQWVLASLVLAALLALANGLSSAQLAAAQPVSGGTYEYGYRYLAPWLGFSAGWLFLCAKTASSATAALGLAAYLAPWLRLPQGFERWVAVVAVALLTGVVLLGARRTSAVNAGMVALTIGGLLTFVLTCFNRGDWAGAGALPPSMLDASGLGDLLHAAALMFVAYTGYGRVATLGEEVVDPRSTVPRAIVLTLALTLLLYVLVAAAMLFALGSTGFGALAGAAPLQSTLVLLEAPLAARIVALAALTALLGVILNLVLGLSRVVLAIGRRGDGPAVMARLDSTERSPTAAVLLVGAAIALLAACGSIRTAWSFSAFTVLIYYALTNACALRLPAEQRLFPRWVAWAGLSGCVGLAVWIEPPVMLAGLGVLAFGLLARGVYRAAARAR